VAEFKDLNRADLDKYTTRSDNLVDIDVPESGPASQRPRDGLLDLNIPPTGRVAPPPGRDPEAPSRPSILSRIFGSQIPMVQGGTFVREFDYTGLPGDLKRRGAHYDVSARLENIKFVEGTSGGMQNAIAQIRYWSRRGTQQKVAVSGEAVSSLPADPVVNTAERVANLSGGVVLASTTYLPDRGRAFPLDPETTPAPAPSNVPVNPTPRSQQVDPPSGGTPPAPGVISLPVQPWTGGAAPAPGPTHSANPGATATAAASIIPDPSQAVWQFLFNPEELQLDSGPEYSRAETWAVSDPTNSGQPLSWRFNKNRKLTFGKVLLTGYVIGKRVDSLEKGLQDLFMAREGVGSDGPPVLEFVWGQRVFGPCVIQNIRVRERAWDTGILVNAEVSFELEQVPEWTINDGFVDIARPGRQATINDPTLPGRTEEVAQQPPVIGTTPTPGQEENKDKPGGGSTAAQTDEAFQASYRVCTKANGFLANFRSQQSALSACSRSYNLRDVNSFDSCVKRVAENVSKTHSYAVSSVGTNFTSKVPSQNTPGNMLAAVNKEIASRSSLERKISSVKVALDSYVDAMNQVVTTDCSATFKKAEEIFRGAAQESERRRSVSPTPAPSTPTRRPFLPWWR
jgi:hypothetical protein